MEKEYYEILGKCLELKDIVDQYGPRIKSWLNTSRDSEDQKISVRMKEFFHTFDETLKIIDEMVNKAYKNGKKYPLVNIVNRFNLDQVERTMLYYCFAKRLEDERMVDPPDLLLLMSKGEYSKIAELRIKYLQMDSKLNKKGIIFNQPLVPKSKLSISGIIYSAIIGETPSSDVEGLDIEEIVSKIEDIPKENIPKSPKEIYDVLSRKVIGQEEAKKVLSTSIFHHYQIIMGNTELRSGNILLIGPTGVGKTYLVRTLTDCFNVPVVFCSANEFTETGYVGKSVGDIIDELLDKANCDIIRAERGIVFIDEIDKIATRGSFFQHYSDRDVSGRSVQEELLDLLESTGRKTFRYGPYLNKQVPLDISKVLFIAAGAFDGLETIHQEKRRKQPIGFVATHSEKIDRVYNQIEVEDLINYGLIPELVGRFSTIVSLSPLSKEDLVRIMVEPEETILKNYKNYFMHFGIELEVERPVLEKIAELAYERKTGARGLRSILESLLRPYCFSVSNNQHKKARLVICEKDFLSWMNGKSNLPADVFEKDGSI